VTVFDAARAWKVDRAKLAGKSRNTPFHGWELRGQVTHTIVGGKVVFEAGGAK
jgi:dihydroorotase